MSKNKAFTIFSSIQYTGLLYLEPMDFQQKTIYALDVTNNENLRYIGQETFKSLNTTLQALLIKNSLFREFLCLLQIWARDVTVYIGLILELFP